MWHCSFLQHPQDAGFSVMPNLSMFLLERSRWNTGNWVGQTHEWSLYNDAELLGCSEKSQLLWHEFASSTQSCLLAGREIQHKIPLCFPCSLGGEYFHDRLAHRLYNGFFFSPQQSGFCVFLVGVAQHSESLLWAEQGQWKPWTQSLLSFSSAHHPRTYFKTKEM